MKRSPIQLKAVAALFALGAPSVATAADNADNADAPVEVVVVSLSLIHI